MSLDEMLKTANEIMDKMEDSDSEEETKKEDAHVIPTKPAWENLRLAVQKLASVVEEVLSIEGVPSTLTRKKWRQRLEKVKKLVE